MILFTLIYGKKKSWLLDGTAVAQMQSCKDFPIWKNPNPKEILICKNPRNKTKNPNDANMIKYATEQTSNDMTAYVCLNCPFCDHLGKNINVGCIILPTSKAQYLYIFGLHVNSSSLFIFWWFPLALQEHIKCAYHHL